MKTRNILSVIALTTLALAGCMTSKTTTVTPGGTNPVTGAVFQPVTNTVTTVNEANLALDCSVIQGVTAGAVSVIIQRSPGAVPALKDAMLGMDAALNGANADTVAKVLSLLGKDNNPVLAQEMTTLVQVASALEQNLLHKYGAEVGGRIAVDISKAIYSGFVIALAGK